MEWEKQEMAALAFQPGRRQGVCFGEACHMRVVLSVFVGMGAVPVLAMGEGRRGEGDDQRTHRRPCVLTRAVTLLC